ncbi:teichoic acid biosynthesis protein C [Actinomadura sp. LD22]|uniref:Teichoic acid biosynthesis protein C n=1 Tax=Actinomadura physcomitrii TaxID=2650748 RepID=A0A6I4MP19_9ACTN|nr:teichoic acid biosynthesis protein C [Actinomadura physcomitrii]MWA07562.1 teichoic acid biosynthesis protein C [Actinomadura physcomitrii]
MRRPVKAAAAAMAGALALGACSAHGGGTARDKTARLNAALAASLPSSARFDLGKPSYDLWRHKNLQDGTVMQAFGFDSVNKRLYVAQVSGASGSDARGDLTVTQLDFSGKKLGYMHLKGFGHGVSIGVEPSGSSAYLWTETDAVKYTDSDGKVTTRGKNIGRFKFVNKGTVTNSSSGLTKYTPVSGQSNVTPAIDPINNRIAMRYKKDGKFRIAVWKLSDLKARNYGARLVDIAQPATVKQDFQGYTLYGRYLYLFNGTAYSASNPKPGNSYISAVDLNTGKLVGKPVFTQAGSTLSYREPEGLAIYKAGTQLRLFLGFASGSSGARQANLFYKKDLA